jgi:hypothetical protein
MSEAVYSEFPITLAHPSFTAAKSLPVPGTEILDGQGRVLRQDFRGTPERFPPVTARDADEEAYYEAQGYGRVGKIDPSAWVQAHSDAPSGSYEPLKYPMWRNGVLYMTAQEDPGASEEDLAPKDAAEPDKAAAEAPQPAGEAENLRATLDEMNRTMKAMAAQMAETKAEANRMAAKNAELEAMLDQATAPAQETAAAQERRAPGRPRKAD